MTSTEQPRPTVTGNLNDQIIELLAAGHTVTQTAAIVGRSTSALYRRLRDKVFMSRVAEARGAQLRPLADAAHEEAPAALQRLVDLSRDPDVHASSRIKANAILVELRLRLHTAQDVEARLAAVEAAIQAATLVQYQLNRSSAQAAEMRKAEEIVLGSLDAEEADR
ncbi:MAG TPA: hypothetical protein VM533_08405 [Fimbriiglobus sp.]|jgi:hypothetical protein|nr:hypothetical protein [Fimbriiglobus sp.]